MGFASLLVRPDHLFLVALCVGGLLGRRRPWAARLTVVALLGLVVIAVFPVGAWILIPLENRFSREAPAKVAGIVVLGGAFQTGIIRERKTLALGESAERLFALGELAHRYPAARLVFAGGEGSLGAAGLGSALPPGELLGSLGIDADRVLLEEHARSTFENAVLTRTLVGEAAMHEPWLLVTSAWHMPRAMGAFRRAGWRIAAWPVDYRTSGRYSVAPGLDLTGGLQRVGLGTREWLLLGVYRLRGRTDSLFPEADPSSP